MLLSKCLNNQDVSIFSIYTRTFIPNLIFFCDFYLGRARSPDSGCKLKRLPATKALDPLL